MASFYLHPGSVFLPNFRLRHSLLAPFRISRTTHLSKYGLHFSVESFIIKKGGAFGETGARRSCCRHSLMTTRAFRGDEGDKRVHVFEQEGLIGGDEDERVPDGGLEATLNSLSKWLVTATIGLVVIVRRDAEALWLLMGSVLNTILANVLKHVLNQDRPVLTLKSDPGMPSSHSQSIFFAATFVIVSMMEWLGVNALTLVLSAFVFAIGSYLSWLRVSQQFHTVSQVLVGAILGSAFSVLFFWSWNAAIQEAYNTHLWVRVCTAVGATGFPLAFVAYVIRHWLKNDS